jgi:hypothetical protein
MTVCDMTSSAYPSAIHCALVESKMFPQHLKAARKAIPTQTSVGSWLDRGVGHPGLGSHIAIHCLGSILAIPAIMGWSVDGSNVHVRLAPATLPRHPRVLQVR